MYGVSRADDGVKPKPLPTGWPEASSIPLNLADFHHPSCSWVSVCASASLCCHGRRVPPASKDYKLQAMLPRGGGTGIHLVHGLEVSTDPRKFAARHPTCEYTPDVVLFRTVEVS